MAVAAEGAVVQQAVWVVAATAKVAAGAVGEAMGPARIPWVLCP